MALVDILQNLIPKESKFFPLLRGQVETINKVADLLMDFFITEDPEEKKEIYARIKAAEKHCDSITNTIFDELNNTFITPFDREDIHLLADQFDDVVDFMNGAAKRAILYRPRTSYVQNIQLVKLLKECGACLTIAVKELEKVKKSPDVVIAQCAELHTIENKADEIYENLLIELFENEKDAVELMRHKEVAMMLETATDKAEDVAAIMKRIIVKYS